MARANPERLLESILNAKDHAEALERLTSGLRRTWASGKNKGWEAGVADANDDREVSTVNPYGKGR